MSSNCGKKPQREAKFKVDCIHVKLFFPLRVQDCLFVLWRKGIYRVMNVKELFKGFIYTGLFNALFTTQTLKTNCVVFGVILNGSRVVQCVLKTLKEMYLDKCIKVKFSFSKMFYFFKCSFLKEFLWILEIVYFWKWVPGVKTILNNTFLKQTFNLALTNSLLWCVSCFYRPHSAAKRLSQTPF